MTDAAKYATSVSWSRIAKRIRVPLGFLFAAFYFWRAKPDWMSLGIGAAVAALGVWMRAVASGHVKKNEELTVSGPYEYCRNPLYLGSIVIAIGFAIAARDVWIAVGILLLFAAIYIPVIRSEEAFLRGHFTEYAEYARRVPRLLPRTILLQGYAAGFSSELYMKHREYNVVIGAAGTLAALIVKMLWFSRSW